MAHIVWGSGGKTTPLRPVFIIGALFLALCFGLLIWPTRWEIASTSERVYRIDRFTGCYQFATDTGWSRPWQRTC